MIFPIFPIIPGKFLHAVAYYNAPSSILVNIDYPVALALRRIALENGVTRTAVRGRDRPAPLYPRPVLDAWSGRGRDTERSSENDWCVECQ